MSEKKRIILILVSGIFIILILYGRSMRPVEIDLVYDGLLYKKDEQLSGDYENLDLEQTMVRIQGKLYKKWFSRPYFEGFIDTEAVPIDRNKFRRGDVVLYNTLPSPIIYTTWTTSNQREIKTESGYVSIATNSDMSWIYLEYEVGSGYEGYSVVAPARNVEDIDIISKKVKWYKDY